jgi:hypothetical protein
VEKRKDFPKKGREMGQTIIKGESWFSARE